MYTAIVSPYILFTYTKPSIKLQHGSRTDVILIGNMLCIRIIIQNMRKVYGNGLCYGNEIEQMLACLLFFDYLSHNYICQWLYF